MKNIVLMGYRCTGKSSVGKRLSEKLNLTFFDSDDVIETQAGISIREMVNRDGWQVFRMKEKEVIEELASKRESIIATGGGAFEDHENRNILKKNGLFIWLTADEETILTRLRADQKSIRQRPSLSYGDLETETATTLQQRNLVYRELADLTVDTSGKRFNEIVDEICNYLKGSDNRSNKT